MKVRLTRPADRDLARIHSYIAHEKPETVSAVIARLLQRIAGLELAPESGWATDQTGVRVLVVRDLRYFVFYRLDGDWIDILHIRHTARRRIS